MKRVSERFADELQAAGLLGLPFSWGEDGALEFGASITADQRAAIQAALANHDPAVPRDAPLVRREERTAALLALVGTEAAEAALDGFFRSIKARQDLPSVVRAYIEKHKL